MIVYLIRHGKTKGNTEKRYIGITDEKLCSEGIRELKGTAYPDCDIVISSPMKRCLETASLLFPNKKVVVCSDLRECDFGAFEGKNYSELCNDTRYQAWLDSMGEMPFPNGESKKSFSERCVRAFSECVENYPDNSRLAFVVHGGTIMAVLEKYALPKKDYYDWQVKNGGGYSCVFQNGTVTVIDKIE